MQRSFDPAPAAPVDPWHHPIWPGAEAREVLRAWLQQGGDPNAVDERGDTVLHRAARKWPAFVEPLLKTGADPSRRNCAGENPLMGAAEAGSVAAAVLLLRAGANPKACDRFGRTAVDAAEQAPATEEGDAVRQVFAEVAACLKEGRALHQWQWRRRSVGTRSGEVR